MGIFSNFLVRRQTVNIVAEGWLQGMSELHCHLLPNVDDGARSIEETIELVDLMSAAGIKRIVFTPHIHHKYPENNESTLRLPFEETSKQLASTGIPLFLGAEYILDEFFDQQLQRPLLTLGSSNALLIEMSFATATADYINILPKIRQRGGTPIMAHPERYLYLSMVDYEELKEEGCALQLNLFSLSGAYGEAVKKRAQTILERRLYDYVATDTHRASTFRRLSEGAFVSKKYENIIRDLVEKGQSLF